MKKIMFNDRFGLTEAVIQGNKTVTRRIINPHKAITSEKIGYSALTPDNHIEIRGYHENGAYGSSFFKKPYKVGEIVAVAQSYETVFYDEHCALPTDTDPQCNGAGFKNKMFVKAEYMPHKIRITAVRSEKLQDITNEDCLREGIKIFEEINCFGFNNIDNEERSVFQNIKTAYASLIDKINGKGTWERNPFVWRIEFELINH